MQITLRKELNYYLYAINYLVILFLANNKVCRSISFSGGSQWFNIFCLLFQAYESGDVYI